MVSQRASAVTDTTAITGSIIPPVITGSGPDQLVLSMSEDAYKGDAQFTVAVDGVQLGGTFATPAQHAAGASQSFVFNGDWGVGAHTVTVNFLNDAYAGTPATDRNLYVNGVSYDGTATLPRRGLDERRSQVIRCHGHRIARCDRQRFRYAGTRHVGGSL